MRSVIGSGGGGTAVALGIVAHKIAIHEVMRMNPLARLDRFGRLADDLAIFANVISFANRLHRDLVPQSHGFGQFNVAPPMSIAWPAGRFRCAATQMLSLGWR